MVAVAAEDDDGKEASQSTKEKKATEKPAVDTETGEIKATATTAGQPKVTEQPTLCPIHKVAWKEGKEGSLYHGPKDPDWCTPAKAYRPNLEAAWAASGLQGKCDEWIAETYNKPWAKLAPGVCEHAVKKLTDHIEGKVLISFETKPDDAGRSRMQDYKKLESAAPKVPTDAMWNVWHELCQQADKLGITYAAVDEKTTSSTELAKQGRMLRALVEAKESQAKEGEEKEGKCT